jgi:hypothetical protein
MTGYIVFVALALFYGSDLLHRTVVARARPLFPSSLQEERKASFVLGAFVWEPSFPADLRHKYLWAVGLGASAILCVVIIAYNTKHPLWAAFFACLFLLTLWHGLKGWIKLLAIRGR